MGILNLFCWPKWPKKPPRKVGKPGKTFPRRVVKTHCGLAVDREPAEHEIKREIVYVSPGDGDSDTYSDRSAC